MCPATTHVEKVAAENFSAQLKHISNTFKQGIHSVESVHDGEGQQYFETFRTTSQVLKASSQ